MISGDDEVRIHAKATELFRQLAGEDPSDFAVDIIVEDDRGPRPELVRQAISSTREPPFMGGSKTIWLKQFTGFDLEPDGKKADDESHDPMGLRALAEYLSKPLADDIFLILEGPDCDEKKALAKACKSHGEVFWYRKPARGKKLVEEMRQCIAEITTRKGVTLSYDAQAALIEALGNDTTLIESEIEKLICYMGGTDQPISAEAVRTLCRPYADQENWAISDPVGNRNLPESLSLAEKLMSMDKDPAGVARSLLYALGHQFQNYIFLRLFMQQRKLNNGFDVKNFLDNLSPEQKRELIASGEAPFATGNLWKAKFAADQAKNYAPSEIIHAICTIRDALLDLNTGGVTAPVALENALLKILPRTTPRR